MKKEIQLPYGSDKVIAQLPENNLTGIFLPHPVPACPDPVAEIQHAIANPLDTPALSLLVRPGEKVIILVDDHTRVTPAGLVLPPVLKALRQGGVKDDNITILITHGTHRQSNEEEVRCKVGEQVYGHIRIEQHQCSEDEHHVYLGLTSRGTPVWINRLVLEADRRIGIGHIGPSPYAGYSGGLKLIVPGAAGLDTINASHSLVPLGFRKPGQVEVPCRQEIDEAASMVGLDLLVDVVLSQDERIAKAFAGTPQRVFQEGLALARQVYEVACPGNVDVAITSGYPYELDLYQAVRAVEYADVVVRDGGSIILAAKCPDGCGDEEFYRLMADREKKPEDYLRDVARRNGRVTFSVLGYNLARIRSEKNLYIVTDGITDVELTKMGFHPLRTLQEGVDALLDEYGAQARMAVFPIGSSTVPVTP